MPDPMAENMIYTQVYSASAQSTAPLVSERGSEGGPMTEEELLTEFGIHADVAGPTALVTVNKRLMDTLDDALQIWQGSNEPPDEIWIAFVEVPADDDDDTHETPSIRVHAAEELAARCEHPDPRRFRDQAVVERAVQDKYVSHRVSLQTLLDRGLLQFLDGASPPWSNSNGNVRERMADIFESLADRPGETGEMLGSFTKHFGARAPLDWIANQIFDDCAGFTAGGEGYETDDELDSNPFDWSATDFGVMGVYIAGELSDWLEDNEFIDAYANFKEWGAVVHEVMFRLETDFWEDWHGGDAAFMDTLSEQDRFAFTTGYRWLLDVLDFLLELIEEEAVKIGL